MTPLEIERLGIVETKVDALTEDVVEMKADLKALLSRQSAEFNLLIEGQSKLSQALAVRDAAARTRVEDMEAQAQWRRWAFPVALTIVNLLFVAVNLFGDYFIVRVTH
jgi:predicted NBD/HSP70 family sugar kinase